MNNKWTVLSSLLLHYLLNSQKRTRSCTPKVILGQMSLWEPHPCNLDPVLWVSVLELVLLACKDNGKYILEKREWFSDLWFKRGFAEGENTARWRRPRRRRVSWQLATLSARTRPAVSFPPARPSPVADWSQRRRRLATLGAVGVKGCTAHSLSADGSFIHSHASIFFVVVVLLGWYSWKCSCSGGWVWFSRVHLFVRDG